MQKARVNQAESEELAVPIETACIINSTLSEILARILHHGNPLSTVMLRDGETGEPVLGVATGPNPDKLTDTRLAPEKGIAGWVAEYKAKIKPIPVLEAMRTK